MPLTEEKLLNDKTVRIAYTNEEQPPTHREAFQNEWNPESKRESLNFYDSTVEYMRNEWTANPANARSAAVELDGKHLLLFFDERTRTWNSPEALDIDHRTPWREHLDNLKVQSRKDAMLAYNDADNLRVVSATYNRARDSADAILDDPTKGVHSPEWKDWVDRRMRFDVGKDYPAYDPDVHGVERSSRTTDAVWTAGVTRKGLAFDDPIKTTWLGHALKEAYAGEVKVPDPDHPDDRAKDHAVQLFRCAATDQLVTRGGLDIDHEIPFTVALESMLNVNREDREFAQASGDEPPLPISKADVMDLYNNPENLRLVARGANSSHEWELQADGHYYDPELVDAEYATAEPTVVVVDDDAAMVYADEVVDGDAAMVSADEVVDDDATMVYADEVVDGDATMVFADEETANSRKRGRDDGDSPLSVHIVDGDSSQPAAKRARCDDDGADVEVSRRDAALLAMHREDFDLFEKIRGKVANLDFGKKEVPSPAQQENLSMALVHGARDQKIDIDHVCLGDSKDSKNLPRLLWGIQGPLHEDTGKFWFPMDAFKNVPLEVTAGYVAEQRQQAAQDVAPVQPQHTPAQHM